MNLAYKFKVFFELFFDKEGWKRVVFVGLRNTLVIAILGLAIGIAKPLGIALKAAAAAAKQQQKGKQKGGKGDPFHLSTQTFRSANRRPR